MNTSILINIGNTHTQLGAVAGNELADVRVVNTQDLITDPETCGLPQDAIAVVASVVPAATKALTTHVRSIHSISAETTTLVDFSGVDASTVGADRVANAIAAAEMGTLPAIVVDCGTAITLEVIDAQRRFLGGIIIPGRHLCRDALHRGTAQLPETPLTDALMALPGRNTADAITAGIDHTLIGGLTSVLEKLSSSCATPATWLATGGDADFFCAHISGLTHAAQHFTLCGLLAQAKAI
jgi:type III pantothenate kinase